MFEFGAKLTLHDGMAGVMKKNIELQRQFREQLSSSGIEIGKLNKQKADPVITAHDRATEVLNSVRENIDNLSQQKALTKAEVQDEASKKVDEIVEKIKEIKKTAVSPIIHLKDTVSPTVGKIKQRLKEIATTYMDVFRVGFITVPVVGGKPYKDNGKPNIDYAKCEELGIKDPDSVDSGYLFREGADHNEITLENEDVIEGIRAYIASRNDYLIVELEDGKEPADPEGTVFECKTALYQLYPAIYKGVSTAEGKTFSFNRGEKQNRYITNDAEEIKILRDYIKTRVDNMFTEVKEGSYV